MFQKKTTHLLLLQVQLRVNDFQEAGQWLAQGPGETVVQLQMRCLLNLNFST